MNMQHNFIFSIILALIGGDLLQSDFLFKTALITPSLHIKGRGNFF